jgi:hypothetical protein
MATKKKAGRSTSRSTSRSTKGTSKKATARAAGGAGGAARAAKAPVKKAAKAAAKRGTTAKAGKTAKTGTRNAAKKATPVVEIEIAPKRRPRVSTDTRPIEERIEERAFLLWLERGGDAVANWIDAEREIRGGG